MNRHGQKMESTLQAEGSARKRTKIGHRPGAPGDCKFPDPEQRDWEERVASPTTESCAPGLGARMTLRSWEITGGFEPRQCQDEVFVSARSDQRLK